MSVQTIPHGKTEVPPFKIPYYVITLNHRLQCLLKCREKKKITSVIHDLTVLQMAYRSEGMI